MGLERKKVYKKEQADSLEKRVLTGKNQKLTPIEREEMKEKHQKDRDLFEEKHMSKRFTLIYPQKAGEDQYKPFLDQAAEIWEVFTTGKKF